MVLNLKRKGIMGVKPEPDIQAPDFFLGSAVPLGFLDLALQGFHLAVDFRQNIVQTKQVLLGGFQLSQGLCFAGFISGGTGGLFDIPSSFFRARFGNGTDVSLLDQGIGSGAHSASHE